MSQNTLLGSFLSNRENRILISSLVAIAAIIVAVNFAERETTDLVANLLYIPVNLFFATTSVILTIRTKEKTLRKFLVFYSFAAISWFVAEQYWTVLELVYHEDVFPSLADLFYLLGYVGLFGALISIVFPRLRQISIDVKLIGIIVSVFFLIPSVVLTSTVLEDDPLARALSLSYPILDSGLLWFASVILMGFTWKKNELMYYLTFGILFFIIADTYFVVSSADETYYVGDPFEIFWLWSYVLFAFAAYRGIKSASIFDNILKRTDIDIRKVRLPLKYRTLLTTGIVVVTSLITISLLNSFKFSLLSSNEEKVIIPAIYISLIFVSISTITGLLFSKKYTSLKSEFEHKLAGDMPSISYEIAMVERQIQMLETRNKKNSIITLMSIVILVSVLLTYSSMSFIESSESSRLATGRFTIENLKGDKISTWVTWHVPKDEQLQVTIINSPGLSDERINAIKEAIVSERSIILENSFVNKYPPNEKSVFYEGWSGALRSISEKTEYPIPTNFLVTTSEKSIGDIIIILSTAREADNTYGFTRSIADEESNQMLKSFITIYNADNLNQVELSAIVRHEFGHALGLVHSTDSEDLMYPIFHSTHAVISECDLDAMISLYNGAKSTEVVCRH
ncbi:MAG: matrixin family metalloprotease [Candidatus Nitrosotenuis sp.]|nr:MAG: matrixin family metalloprotease [Candidatus Nitrosotenuis sp.]